MILNFYSFLTHIIHKLPKVLKMVVISLELFMQVMLVKSDQKDCDHNLSKHIQFA